MTQLLELREVSKRFEQPLDLAARVARLVGVRVQDSVVHAVDKVSLTVGKGEVVGLVGESGCGKSTLARLAAGLQPLSSGRRLWKGIDISDEGETSGENSGERGVESSEEVARGTGQNMRLAIQMIFQDPYASLNPRMRVLDLIGEAPIAHRLIRKDEQRDYVARQLDRVGLDPALMGRFPHQFSGGQRARIGIARALAVAPELLICDEAVASLDVSIQAQVIDLFMRLRDELGLGYLFISHDIGVVRHVSDRVVVMYLGRVIESAPTDTLFARPRHPYTEALLAATPKLEVGKREFAAIKGEIPSPLNPPSGCHFHPRCPYAHTVPDGRCKIEVPLLKDTAAWHLAACHLNDDA